MKHLNLIETISITKLITSVCSIIQYPSHILSDAIFSAILIHLIYFTQLIYTGKNYSTNLLLEINDMQFNYTLVAKMLYFQLD